MLKHLCRVDIKKKMAIHKEKEIQIHIGTRLNLFCYNITILCVPKIQVANSSNSEYLFTHMLMQNICRKLFILFSIAPIHN